MKGAAPKYITDNAALNELQRAVGAQSSLSASQTIVGIIWQHILRESRLADSGILKYGFVKHDKVIPLPQVRTDTAGIVKRLHTYILDSRDVSIQRLCTVVSAMCAVGTLLGIPANVADGKVTSELVSSPLVSAWTSMLRALILSFSSTHAPRLMIPSRFLFGMSRGISEIVSSLDTLQTELAVPAIKELTLPADAQKVLVRVARVYSNHDLRSAQMDALTFLTEPAYDVAVSIRLLLIAMLLAQSEHPEQHYDEALRALKNTLYYSVMRTIPVTLELTMRIFLSQGLLRFCLSPGFLDIFLAPGWENNADTSTTLFACISTFYLSGMHGGSNSDDSEEDAGEDADETLVQRFLSVIGLVREKNGSNNNDERTESSIFRAICSRVFKCADDTEELTAFLLKFLLLKYCGSITREDLVGELVAYATDLANIYAQKSIISMDPELAPRVPLLVEDIYTGKRFGELTSQALKETVQNMINMPIYWLHKNRDSFPLMSLLYLLYTHGETAGFALLSSVLQNNSGSNISEKIHQDLATIACSVAPWLLQLSIFQRNTNATPGEQDIHTDIPMFHDLATFSSSLDTFINAQAYHQLGRLATNIVFMPQCSEALDMVWTRMCTFSFDTRAHIYTGIYTEVHELLLCARKLKAEPSSVNLSPADCARQLVYNQIMAFTEKYLISTICAKNCADVIASINMLPSATLLLTCDSIKSRLELADIRTLLCGVLLSAHPLIQEFYVWLLTTSIIIECADDLLRQRRGDNVSHFSKEGGWIRSYYRNYVATIVRLAFHVDSNNSNNEKHCTSDTTSCSVKYLMSNVILSARHGSLPALYCLREILTYATDVYMYGKNQDLSSLAHSLLRNNSKGASMAADACIQSIEERSLPDNIRSTALNTTLIRYLMDPSSLRPLLESLGNGKCWRWAVTLNSVATYEQTAELVTSFFNEMVHFTAAIARALPADEQHLRELCEAFGTAQCNYIPHAQLLADLYFAQKSAKLPSVVTTRFFDAAARMFQASLSNELNGGVDNSAEYDSICICEDKVAILSEVTQHEAQELISTVILPLFLSSTAKTSVLCARLCGMLIARMLTLSSANCATDAAVGEGHIVAVSFAIHLFRQLVASLTFATRQSSAKVSRCLPYILKFVEGGNIEDGLDAPRLSIIVSLMYFIISAFEVTQAQFVLMGIEHCISALKQAAPILSKQFIHALSLIIDDDTNNVYLKAFRRNHSASIAEVASYTSEEMKTIKEKCKALLGGECSQLLMDSSLDSSAILDSLIQM